MFVAIEETSKKVAALMVECVEWKEKLKKRCSYIGEAFFFSTENNKFSNSITHLRNFDFY